MHVENEGELLWCDLTEKLLFFYIMWFVVYIGKTWHQDVMFCGDVLDCYTGDVLEPNIGHQTPSEILWSPCCDIVVLMAQGGPTHAVSER